METGCESRSVSGPSWIAVVSLVWSVALPVPLQFEHQWRRGCAVRHLLAVARRVAQGRRTCSPWNMLEVDSLREEETEVY
jgi:hypothetical protein